MNRRVIVRLLLPMLLIGQPGSVALAHASPVEASVPAATSGQAGHCARRNGTAGAHVRHGAEAAPSGSHDRGPPGVTDCRTHSTCTCDCAGTNAVPVTCSAAPRALPDHPAVIGVAVPPIERRIVEFLRPPI